MFRDGSYSKLISRVISLRKYIGVGDNVNHFLIIRFLNTIYFIHKY